MARGWVAAACVVAGVAVLAGLGWALLAAGALTWLTPRALPPTLAGRVKAVWSSVLGRIRRVEWAGRGRRSASVIAMGLAMLAIPLGVGLSIGAGPAIITSGVLLVSFSLLAGWNR